MVDPLPATPVRLDAPGLLLRAYLDTDAPDLTAAFADEDIARWNPGSPDPEAVEAFMASRNDWSTGDHASWAVADPTGRLAGSVSIHRLDRDQGDAEIGYWIAPWARRRGYAVRAVLLATRFGFGPLGLHRLYLYHAVDNPGSCAVALAAGYLHEGTLRQSFRYADGVHHDEHLHGRLSADPEPERAAR
ncbi:GNAT family N-acetyltransferase [Ornithinimicrobium cerasi]|uniref:GNAT family N-acetyltransferase n=1 Tax=Ornithinimicrobium cerasi TaxID=2248773 RepID=UPI00192A62BA|nr:GNAT family N-acetyltransferase [Ornithinimicrobium cerasi]